MALRIDHVGVLVDDLEGTEALLEIVGFKKTRAFVSDGGLRVAFYSCGDGQLEVMHVAGDEERRRRLGGAACRIDHIAVEVAELAVAQQKLAASAVEFMSRPAPAGAPPAAWTVPATSHGLKLQIVQHPVTGEPESRRER